jgi:hypothetical protein
MTGIAIPGTQKICLVSGNSFSDFEGNFFCYFPGSVANVNTRRYNLYT